MRSSWNIHIDPLMNPGNLTYEFDLLLAATVDPIPSLSFESEIRILTNENVPFFLFFPQATRTEQKISYYYASGVLGTLWAVPKRTVSGSVCFAREKTELFL